MQIFYYFLNCDRPIQFAILNNEELIFLVRVFVSEVAFNTSRNSFLPAVTHNVVCKQRISNRKNILKKSITNNYNMIVNIIKVHTKYFTTSTH